MLSDLELCQLCADIYTDPPTGHWDNVWPTHFGFAGHKRIDGIDYIIRRGSKAPSDWWVDLDSVPVHTNLLGGVHAGFYGSVMFTCQRIESVLGKQFVLAGHSLGAAESAIHAALLTANRRPPSKVVLFGSPRPFFPFARALLERAKVPVVNYKNPGDIVTEVPLHSWIWPYVEPADFIMLGDHADPKDTELFRGHHCSVYLAGLTALECQSSAQAP